MAADVDALVDRPVALGELQRLHPAILATHFCNVKDNVAWLFSDDGDVDGAAAFLCNLLWNEEAMKEPSMRLPNSQHS